MEIWLFFPFRKTRQCCFWLQSFMTSDWKFTQESFISSRTLTLLWAPFFWDHVCVGLDRFLVGVELLIWEPTLSTVFIPVVWFFTCKAVMHLWWYGSEWGYLPSCFYITFWEVGAGRADYSVFVSLWLGGVLSCFVCFSGLCCLLVRVNC